MKRWFSWDRRKSDLEEELASHLRLAIAERVARGEDPAAARAAALREIGNLPLIEDVTRKQWGWEWAEQIMYDLRYALRQLRRSPVFTIAAVAALALGIGANTAIFSVVDTVLLKPLNYPLADRMVNFLRPSSVIAGNLHNIPEFHFFQRQTSLFKEVVAFDNAGPGYNLTGGSRPEQVNGIHVTEGYFRVYGAPILLGRTFTPQEDQPHGGNVVVLSYGLWQRRFGGDKSIVGKSISLGNQPYTVVGVTGRDFVADVQADLWLPFQFERVSNDMNMFFYMTGLLQPGVSVAQANAQLQIAYSEYHREYPDTSAHPDFAVGPLFDSIVSDARSSLLMILSAVALVLLIACANVANLLLARAAARKREFAVRAALGAGRGRIVFQLLIESTLLSVSGGILGLVLGFAGVRALLQIAPAGLPRIGENGSAVGIDWRVLAFTLIVSLLTGILFGVFPAFAASRADVNASLNQGGSRSGTGHREGRTRSILVVSEISLALVLLIGSALLIRTFVALHAVDPGFDAHNIVTMEMSLNGPRYQNTAGVSQLLRNGRDRLNALAGVEVAAAAYWLPNDVEDGMGFQIIGRPVKKDCCGSAWMSVTPGYLNLFKIPILRGRDFTENDKAGAPGVALINESLARQLWPNEDPVGQHVMCGQGLGPDFNGEPERQIIGIVADSHNTGLGNPASPMMMVPIAQVPDGYAAAYDNIQPLFWIVRTHGDPHSAIPAITEQLRNASDGFPVSHIRTMDEVMGNSTARQNFNMLLLSIFGGVALVLAAIGIYGLMSYSVEQRTREMGIRLALGADRAALRRLVVGQAMRLTVAGVILGLAAASGLTRLIAGFLFGVKAWDPPAFIAAPLILLSVALIAAWLPSSRASRVDPMEALRTE